MRLIPFLLFFMIFFSACKPESKIGVSDEKESIGLDSSKLKEEPKEQDLLNIEYPSVQPISSYENTRFINTLESKFDLDKNSIYTSSLCYAWEGITAKVNGKISSIEGNALRELNESISYHGVLPSELIKNEILINDGVIESKSSFSLSLPFKGQMTKFNKKLSFKGEEVQNFGSTGMDDRVMIFYYFDDENFAINLIPEDTKHEIILVKSQFDKQTNFKSLYEKMEKEQKRFFSGGTSFWKYEIWDDDQVKIPCFSFNIEGSNQSLIGSHFRTDSRHYELLNVYQKNAFILNEKGAKIDSYVAVAADATEPEERKPKRMFFDNDFIIFIKRKESDYPYFAMFVANAELMEK